MSKNNTPGENPVDEEYVSLHNDVEFLSDALAAVSAEIRNQEISKYPVFVAAQIPLEIGKPLFTRDENQTHWNISVATLEVMVKNEVVSMSKVDEFRKVYKDPNKFFCFLVMKEQPQFVFIKKSVIQREL